VLQKTKGQPASEFLRRTGAWAGSLKGSLAESIARGVDGSLNVFRFFFSGTARAVRFFAITRRINQRAASPLRN